MFSLDGKQLAFITSLGQPNFFYANRHIALVDLATVLKRPAVDRRRCSRFDSKFR